MSTEQHTAGVRAGQVARNWAWEGLLVGLAVLAVVVGVLLSDRFLTAGNINVILGNQAERALMILPDRAPARRGGDRPVHRVDRGALRASSWAGCFSRVRRSRSRSLPPWRSEQGPASSMACWSPASACRPSSSPSRLSRYSVASAT